MSIEKAHAIARFHEADRLYRIKDYAGALQILDELYRDYDKSHHIINARARALARVERFDEALLLCDRLVDEFAYDKGQWLRERVLKKKLAATRRAAETIPDDDMRNAKTQADSDDACPPLPLPKGMTASSSSNSDEDLGDFGSTEEPEGKGKGLFRIKPISLIIVLLLVAGVATGYVPYWLGGGLIVGYFVLNMMIRALFYRLFSTPFKMKGKALQDAGVEVHQVLPTLPPTDLDDEGGEDHGPRSYYWIDVTITPQVRTSGFTHWEPGELSLAPVSQRIKKIDDIEQCMPVLSVKLLVDGVEQEDEGDKLRGAQRIKVLVALPQGFGRYKFVYYFESFGDFKVGG